MKRRPSRALEVFVVFLRLGLTSFGGPVAHLGYFNAEFVVRRKWLREDEFAQIVALCQLLPGPASSQVGVILGLMRGGIAGAIAAWLGFTLPSATILTVFALGIAWFPDIAHLAWIHGLLVASVAVVAVAAAAMYRSLCPDTPRKTFALVVAAVILVMPASGVSQLVIIVAGGIFGRFALRQTARNATAFGTFGTRLSAIAFGTAYVSLVLGLPIVAHVTAFGPLRAITAFYESGALVFGGGHVVLPLLQTRVVTPQWIASDTFLAGYGAAQAVPGPLFTFAAFLGAAMHGPISGVSGATIALISIYLPSFLLIGAVLPFWNTIVRNPGLTAALHGINAAVVGLLIAAFYQPVWTSAIRGPGDAALAIAAFLALHVWKAPPWAVVIGSAIAAQAIGFIRPL